MATKNTSYILLGIKHSGKSTQGKILAKKLNCKFYDTDEAVTRATGKTPRQIYNESGAEAFMQAELDACSKIIETCQMSIQQQAASAPPAATSHPGKQRAKRAVIATGGGICDNEAAIATLRNFGKFIFLETPEKTAADRIVRKISVDSDGNMQNLPAYIKKENPQDILGVRKIFHAYYEKRTKAYKKIADITVKLENAPIWKNAELIWEKISKS